MISVGIHIDNQGFHVVEISLKKRVMKCLSTYSYIFSKDVPEAQSQIILVEYLQSLENKYKKERVRFCYSLPQRQVSSFSLHLPFKEKFKILKTLPFQIEDQSPFRLNDIFYDGRVSKIHKNSSDVICFVTPKVYVEKFLQFAKVLKTKPFLLSASGAAVANAVQDWKTSRVKRNKEVKNGLYVYLGFDETVVLFFKDGYLESVSSLDWNMNSIVDQMISHYKLSKEEAVAQFFEKSFLLTSQKGFTKEQMFFSKLIKKEVLPLVHALKILKLSLETENNAHLKEAVILGPGSVIKNLSAFLSEEISCQVSRLKKSPNLKSYDLSQPDNHKFIVALGLAIEGVKKPPYGGLNFLHTLQQETFSLFPKKWRFAFASGFLILCAFFGYAYIRNQESQVLADKMNVIFERYATKIVSLRRSQVSPQSVKKYLANQKKMIEMEEVIKKKISVTSSMDRLKVLTETIGKNDNWDLSISYLQIEDKKVVIKGFIKEDKLFELKSRLGKVAKSSVREVKEEEKEGLPIKDDSALKKNETKKEDDAAVKESKDKKEIEILEEEKSLARFSYKFTLKGGL